MSSDVVSNCACRRKSMLLNADYVVDALATGITGSCGNRCQEETTDEPHNDWIISRHVPLPPFSHECWHTPIRHHAA